jgi:L-asparagine transporter-like permease
MGATSTIMNVVVLKSIPSNIEKGIYMSDVRTTYVQKATSPWKALKQYK